MRKFLWSIITKIYPAYLRKRFGMNIGENCRIAWSAHLDKSINPKGVHIGDNVWILRESMILAHDHCRDVRADVVIGNDCVIGIRSIIMPGITIGNQTVIGGGSVVTKSFPSNCIVAGNPARIIREGIHVQNGKIIG